MGFEFPVELMEDGTYRISAGIFKGQEVYEYNSCPKKDLYTLNFLIIYFLWVCAFSPLFFIFFNNGEMHFGKWIGFLAFIVLPFFTVLFMVRSSYVIERKEGEAFEERKRERERQRELERSESQNNK